MVKAIAQWALKDRLNNFDMLCLVVAIWTATEGHPLGAIAVVIGGAIMSATAQTILGVNYD